LICVVACSTEVIILTWRGGSVLRVDDSLFGATRARVSLQKLWLIYQVSRKVWAVSLWPTCTLRSLSPSVPVPEPLFYRPVPTDTDVICSAAEMPRIRWRWYSVRCCSYRGVVAVLGNSQPNKSRQRTYDQAVVTVDVDSACVLVPVSSVDLLVAADFYFICTQQCNNILTELRCCLTCYFLAAHITYVCENFNETG